MRESPHFRFCDHSDESEDDEEDRARLRQALEKHGIDPSNGAKGGGSEENGRRTTQQSILALLENVANSASAFAQQIHQSTLMNDASGNAAGRSAAPTSAAERREQRAERKRRNDALLERISKTPVNLLFGVRIRRKYAAEVTKKYGFDPQPYYAHLSSDAAGGAPQTDSGDCTPQSANSSDSEAPPGTPPPTVPRTNPPSARKAAAAQQQQQEQEQQKGPIRTSRPRTTSSSNSSDDHSSSSSPLPSLQTKEGYSASRINGVDPRRVAARIAAEKIQEEARKAKEAIVGPYKRQTARRTGGPPGYRPLPPYDQPRPSETEPPPAKIARTRNAAGSTPRPSVDPADVNEEELDVLSWMERLKLEQSGGQPTPPAPPITFDAADAAANMLQNFMLDVASRDNMQIPPDAMNLLQEALISAARENGGSGGGESSQIDEVDRQAARAMATTFIQSAAVVGRNERKARQTGGSTVGSSSSSSSTSSAAAAAAAAVALADIPGLSPSTANEVWREIQAYLQNLYASAQAEARETAAASGTSVEAKNGINPPPLGSAIAATLVAAAQSTPGLSDSTGLNQQQSPLMHPMLQSMDPFSPMPQDAPGSSGFSIAKQPASTNRTTKKKQKKKNKSTATVSNTYITEMLEKRREIMRLQTEKQREHAAAVAELREHEARLREVQQRKPKNPKMPFEIRYTQPPPVKNKGGSDAAESSGTHPIVSGSRFAPRPQIPTVNSKWFEIVPPPRPPFRIGTGPWGPTYTLNQLAITCHHQWLDDRMIARGLRAYFIIWNIEIRRLHRGCSVPIQEVRMCLRLHSREHRNGFLSFLTDGKSVQMLAARDEEAETFDDEIQNNQIYWVPCIHEFEWNGSINFDRMVRYHKRFIAQDPLLPPLPGDFWFLMNQLHYGVKQAEVDEQFGLQQYAKSLEHEDCSCIRCFSEKQFMERNVYNPPMPAVLPFSNQKHRVDLILPTNFILGQTTEEQCRLFKNQAVLADGAVAIPRAPCIEEELQAARTKRKNSSATTKTAESTPPLAEEASPTVEEPTEVAAAVEEMEPKQTTKLANKKRKKRK